MSSTAKLSHSSHSNCLASTSTSPQSTYQDENYHPLDQDDPCMVYWDHHEPFGLLNQLKANPAFSNPLQPCKSPANDPLLNTPSKTSGKPASVAKRNSTIAGIPSPSKPQPGDTHQQTKYQTRRALRNCKRTKGQPPPLCNQSPQPVHPNLVTPLPPRQRDALHALTSRISIKKKQAVSPHANSTITPQPNLISNQPTTILPSISDKGKQPDRSDQNHDARNHPLLNQITSTHAKAPSVEAGTKEDCKFTKTPLQPNHSSHAQSHLHHINSSTEFSPSNQSNQTRLIQKRQAPTHPNPTHQYQPRDESKLRHSTTSTASSPHGARTSAIKSHPQKTTNVVNESDAVVSCEPWDVEDDDEFGSQLLQLVDLVEKEQQEISSHPESIKEKYSTASKEPRTSMLPEPRPSRTNSANPRDGKESYALHPAEARNAANSEKKNQPSERRTEEASPRGGLVQPKPNFKQATTATHAKKQNPISAAYKNALLVSKPMISSQVANTSYRPPPSHHSNGLSKPGSLSSAQKVAPGVAGKPEVIPTGSVKNSSRSGTITTSIGLPPSKLNSSCINTKTATHSLHAVQKISYSTALVGNHLVQNMDQAHHDNRSSNTRSLKSATITTTTNRVKNGLLTNKSLDMDLLFSGIVGDDLDWDPNE